MTTAIPSIPIGTLSRSTPSDKSDMSDSSSSLASCRLESCVSPPPSIISLLPGDVIHHHASTALPAAKRAARLADLRRVFPDISNPIIITSGNSRLTIIRQEESTKH
jgi:hypothetical protein